MTLGATALERTVGWKFRKQPWAPLRPAAQADDPWSVRVLPRAAFGAQPAGGDGVGPEAGDVAVLHHFMGSPRGRRAWSPAQLLRWLRPAPAAPAERCAATTCPDTYTLSTYHKQSVAMVRGKLSTAGRSRAKQRGRAAQVWQQSSRVRRGCGGGERSSRGGGRRRGSVRAVPGVDRVGAAVHDAGGPGWRWRRAGKG